VDQQPMKTRIEKQTILCGGQNTEVQLPYLHTFIQQMELSKPEFLD
jgi:hypothetical protein